MRHFLLTNTDTDQYIARRSLSRGFLAADIKEQKEASVAPNGSKYMDLRFFLSTFNISEKSVSSAGFALSDRCKAALPASIEMRLVLHINCFFLGIYDVADLMP